jgi:LysR family transcriptional regulator, low CO2-responsive transcriptional regulator
MRVTFRQLQLFLAVAETGSVTAAARACHVTQPTVSMQLRELSEAVGEPLHEQIGKRWTLTQAGEALLSAARAMSQEWAAFEQTLAALKGLARGRLRLAVVTTAKYFVPGALGSFCAQHPNVEIALQVLNRDGVVARLRENRDDLYIMSMPPRDLALELTVFMPNPLVVIAPPKHPLAKCRSIALQALAAERFVLRERGSGTRLTCDAQFAKLKFVPNVRLELGSNEAIRHSVAAGLGLSILSRHALSRADRNVVAVLDVRGFPLESHWFILYPEGRRLSPIAVEFVGHLLKTANRQTVGLS